MTYVTRGVFAIASLLLMLLAIGLVCVGMMELASGLGGSADAIGDAILDLLGYVIVAIAVFDVAKYLFEEEVAREIEKRGAAQTRRSLTKFLSTIVIALFLEGLVLVFKTAREDVSLMLFPSGLIVASVVVLIGLGVYQRFSASAEEKVGADDAADEAGETTTDRPRASKAGTAKT